MAIGISRLLKHAWVVLPLTLTVLSSVGSGQQKVPFQGTIPVAPRGLSGKRLPERPVEFDTAEGQRIRDVRQGPDGLLYVLTDQQEGAVLRIEPVD